MEPFEILDHTADIGIVARGRDPKELFVNAARGMFSVVTDLGRVNGGFETEVAVEGNDYEDLLVTWLNELLYLFEVESVLFKDFFIREIGRYSLKGLVRGEPIDPRRHIIDRQIKACTYYEARVEKDGEGRWKAQVYFDL